MRGVLAARRAAAGQPRVSAGRMQAIDAAIARGEVRHDGGPCFAVEPRLPVRYLPPGPGHAAEPVVAATG